MCKKSIDLEEICSRLSFNGVATLMSTYWDLCFSLFLVVILLILNVLFMYC